MPGMTPDEFFSQIAGPPSFKFDVPGTTVTGTITDLQVVQSRTYDPTGGPGEPKVWPSGDPQMELRITLQTTLRDSKIDDDDGRRRVYVDGRRIREAVKEAFTRVGATGLEVGGEYTQTFTGYDPESKNPKNPAKLYTVVYVKPNPNAQVFGQGQQPTSAAAQPTPATAPSSDGINPALAAALGNLPPDVLALIQAQQAKTG